MKKRRKGEQDVKESKNDSLYNFFEFEKKCWNLHVKMIFI